MRCASRRVRCLLLARARAESSTAVEPVASSVEVSPASASPHAHPASAPPYARPYVLPLRIERGVDVLHDPVFNKGTGFPVSERDRLGIRGLVPPRVLDIDQQADKVYKDYLTRATPLDKWLALQALQDRNETLFYRVVIDHIEEMAPVIYTPTVGEVCLQYSRLYRRARGMYFSADDVGEMHAMVYNWPSDRVDVIVLTDGSRILGLGDLGVQGMGIPIGKLDLYVAGAGIHPSFVLPVCLDVGTDNVGLRSSPWYLGIARPRLTGAPYYAAVDELVSALRSRWPHAVLQFEDFSSDHAAALLARYRHGSGPTWNDDIQGTAAVVLAGVYGALAAQGLPAGSLASQRFLVCGTGSAGMGITQALCAAMQRHGMTPADARRAFCLVDAHGVVGAARPAPPGEEGVRTPASAFGRDDLADGTPLEAAIDAFRPTALLGLSTVRGLFTQGALQRMGQINTRPIVFALSNPTSRSECTAADVAAATEGRAIFGAGSPFDDAADPVTGRVMRANQGNNFYIFPGVGLGCVLSGSPRVSEDMLCAAAEALPRMLSPDQLARGEIFPRIADIRKVSACVAAAVVRAAAAESGCRNAEALDLLAQGTSDGGLAAWAFGKMYSPAYVPLVCSNAHRS